VLIEFTPDRALYPFESRWFDSSRGRMHYIDEGIGPPILFCHGNPTWSFLYRDIIVRLRHRFRCIGADNLGFGLSERPSGYGYTLDDHAQVLGELVDHLGLDQFVTMVQDWGGPIGLAVATARAERVSGIILGNTWFWPADRFSMKLASAVMSTLPMQYLIANSSFAVKRLMAMGTERSLSPEEMRHYRQAQPAHARAGVAEMPKQILAARPTLARLALDVPRTLGHKPTLLVWGMKDPLFPSRSIPRMRDTFTDHVVVELPDANHFIQEDAPDQIAVAIAQRFGDLPSGAA
jgi:haloalkane dehalogenase